ncbi:MAG: PQQ-binding-like beta-propeller repeat protein [Pirellulaceae bacterium]
MRRYLLSALCTCIVSLGGSVLFAQTGDEQQDWTQWRGPERTGIFNGSPLPDQLDDSTLERVWRVEMGPSYSGPLVVGDKVFVTETKDKSYEVVRALDRKSGQQLWEASWTGSMQVPFYAASNGSWIRSTPAYSDGKLYVGGMVDMLVCLNAENGSEIWKIDFPGERGTRKPDFGFVSSPLIIGDDLYVQAGEAFCKINKHTGEMIWQTLRDGGGMMGSAFSSPVIAELNGQMQLLVQTRSFLAGVDPENGKVLWSQEVPTFRGMNILTPTAFGDSVFTSAYGGRSFMYNVSHSGEEWDSSTAWQNRSQAYMSSPVVKDGHLYMHLRNQRFTCINLESGETKWTSEPYGKYASLLLQDDKVLALDQRGELLMFNATPEKFDLLSQHRISDQETWAHLAASGNELFIRELNAVSAFRFKSR